MGPIKSIKVLRNNNHRLSDDGLMVDSEVSKNLYISPTDNDKKFLDIERI